MSVIVIFILVFTILVARKSRPASNKVGHLLNHDSRLAKEPETLKVASYNIQTGKDLNGKRNLLASAKVLASADLVGVQEVYGVGFGGITSWRASQTEQIAAHGNFAWLFSATKRRWFREHRGNAILSRIKISNWCIEMLPDLSGKSYRNMTIAKVHWRGDSFYFINTHLHTREGREAQLELVLQEFAKYSRAILCGDFNSRADTEALAAALKDIEITDAIFSANLDLGNSNRIDWILTKGFEVVGGHMVEKGVSDHPYYQVELLYQ